MFKNILIINKSENRTKQASLNFQDLQPHIELVLLCCVKENDVCYVMQCSKSLCTAHTLVTCFFACVCVKSIESEMYKHHQRLRKLL